MSAPSGVKLRESCESCAVSKVKCSKNKPTCARCAERGTTCQYLVTQRTGRKARGGSKGNASSHGTIEPLPIYPSFPQLETLSPGDLFLDSPFTALDPRLDDFILASRPLSPSFSRPVASGSNQNTFQNQPDESSVVAGYTSNHKSVDVPLQSWENLLCTSSTEMDLDRFEHYGLADLAGACSSIPTTPQLSQSSDTATQSPRPESDCVETALQFISQLPCPQEFPLQCTSLSTITTTGYGHDHDHQATCLLPSPQTVIDKNKEAIEAIGDMLQLPCSQDGYFIILVSLVVSRVLSRYAAVARGGFYSTLENDSEQSWSLSSAPSSSHRSSSSAAPERVHSGPPLKRREEIDPKTAQKVLNELYQVQGLIDKLALRIQQCEKRNRTFGGEVFPLDNSNDTTSLSAFPFSSTVLNQLDTELRKRIRVLSLELIDRLRHYWG